MHPRLAIWPSPSLTPRGAGRGPVPLLAAALIAIGLGACGGGGDGGGGGGGADGSAVESGAGDGGGSSTDGGGVADAATSDDGGVPFDGAPEADAATDGGMTGTDGGMTGTDGGMTGADGGMPSLACNFCHGDMTGNAPPRSTSGVTDTGDRGVGAHRSHLRAGDPSAWHREVICEDCHIVPSHYLDPEHIDTGLPAELTWGAVATEEMARPEFDGMVCSNVYCHGATLLPGGSNTTPNWTTVDGSQAACGTCHGLPPGGRHPARTDCASCHPTMNAAGVIIAPDQHIDGTLDVDLTGLTCTGCHGTDGVGPAPPRDTAGRRATTRRGVGAHQSHLGASDWHAPIACTQCHRYPGAVDDPRHNDTPLPAELTWGPRARADRAMPDWNGTTCSGVYCHGATLEPGGTNTTPRWTTVDGSQAACGTCHGLPPGGNHVGIRECDLCHGAVIDASDRIIAPALHINGRIEATPYHPTGFRNPGSHGVEANNGGLAACQTCHGNNLLGGLARVSCETCHSGWQTDCTFCHGSEPTNDPAPPEGVNGETARTNLVVGAHQEHVDATSMHVAWGCEMCHLEPTSALSPGHIDGDGRAEVVFTQGPAWERGGNYAYGTGVCSNLYCHGNGSSIRGSQDWDTNPTLDCGSCHAPFTRPSQTELRAMSGRHDKHVRDRGYSCDVCHGNVVDGSGDLLRVDLHVDGNVDVNVPSFDPDACGGVGSCNPSCHGSECWR